MEQFAEPGEQGLVFVRPRGGKLRRSNFHESVPSPAREAVGSAKVHVPGLRHTGATLSATSGATLKELMGGLGTSLYELP